MKSYVLEGILEGSPLTVRLHTADRSVWLADVVHRELRAYLRMSEQQIDVELQDARVSVSTSAKGAPWQVKYKEHSYNVEQLPQAAASAVHLLQRLNTAKFTATKAAERTQSPCSQPDGNGQRIDVVGLGSASARMGGIALPNPLLPGWVADEARDLAEEQFEVKRDKLVQDWPLSRPLDKPHVISERCYGDNVAHNCLVEYGTVYILPDLIVSDLKRAQRFQRWSNWVIPYFSASFTVIAEAQEDFDMRLNALKLAVGKVETYGAMQSEVECDDDWWNPVCVGRVCQVVSYRHP